MSKKMIVFIFIVFFSFSIIGCSKQYGNYVLNNEGINNKVGSYSVIDGKLTYIFNKGKGRALYHDGKVSPVHKNIFLDSVSYLKDGSVFFVASEGFNKESYFVFENKEFQEKYSYFDRIIPLEGNIIAIVDEENKEYLYNFDQTDLSLVELKQKAKSESKVQKNNIDTTDCSIEDEFGTDIVDYEKPGFYLKCDGKRVSNNYPYINKNSILKIDGKYAFSVQNNLNSFMVIYDNIEIGADKMNNRGGITPNLILYDNKIYFNCCGELYSIAEK